MGMAEKQTLLAVVHLEQYLGPVIDFLQTRELEGRRVLTEIADRPEKYSEPFYGALLEYLSKRGAVLLHEEGEKELSRLAVAEYEQRFLTAFMQETEKLDNLGRDAALEEEMRILEARIALLEAHYREYALLTIKWRNPNILRLIVEEDPDYVIMGAAHVRDVYPDLVAAHNRELELIEIPGGIDAWE